MNIFSLLFIMTLLPSLASARCETALFVDFDIKTWATGDTKDKKVTQRDVNKIIKRLIKKGYDIKLSNSKGQSSEDYDEILKSNSADFLIKFFNPSPGYMPGPLSSSLNVEVYDTSKGLSLYPSFALGLEAILFKHKVPHFLRHGLLYKVISRKIPNCRSIHKSTMLKRI